jgi:hypothetical protein
MTTPEQARELAAALLGIARACEEHCLNGMAAKITEAARALDDMADQLDEAQKMVKLYGDEALRLRKLDTSF